MDPGAMTPRAPRPSPDRARWFWTGLVVALFCLPLFVGLGGTDDENDEAIYSFAVDVMVKSGDWLTPKSIPSEQEAFLEKPPLKFWIVAAPIRLGLLPHNEFGRRFWDALFGAIAFLYVFAIGRRLGGSLCGAAAVLVLFAHTPLLFQHGLRGNNMEAAVVLAYCAGAYHFIGWRTSDRARARRGHVVAVALYFVLAFMTKFVAALFLPLVLAPFAVASREDRARFREDWRAWGGAALLAVALIAPWFLYQYHQFGRDLWSIMFGQHVLTRFTSYLDPAHLHPWHYYFTEMFAQVRQSGATIVAAAGLALLIVAAVRPSVQRPAARLVLVWFALPLGLMSLLSSKLYHYAYPFVPPVALAAGYAAAILFGLLWRAGARPAARLDARLADRLPGALRARRVQVALLALGIVAVLVAMATVAAGGRLHVTVGHTLLFRNASALRAGLIATLLFVLAARLGTALRAGVAAGLVLLLLPIPTYSRTLARLPVERHPLRSLATCLQAVNARASDPARRAPGVWVEAETIAHTYFYYLRGLGPWEYRRGRREASDATVYMRLYLPPQTTPVLLSEQRYEEVQRRVRAGDQALLEWVGRKSGMGATAAAAAASQMRVSVLRFGPEVLLLPEPYADCGFDPQVRGLR